ncbi:hypothetical protein D3C76_1172200 [compost metagenome]
MHQQFDIAFALTQRWQGDGDNVQAVIEVFTELAFGNVLFQILVGGGDNADIDRDRLAGADRQHLTGFHRAQQLGLQH